VLHTCTWFFKTTLRAFLIIFVTIMIGSVLFKVRRFTNLRFTNWFVRTTDS
jgi:hypothetical protein